MRDSIAKIDAVLLENQRNDQSIVLDGAVDADRYLSANPRILWIIREPNGSGPWDLRKYFRETLFSYNRWKSTAGLMIRVSHGLLNGRKAWGEWAADVKAIADCLRDVAVINVNKRGGESRVNWGRLYHASLEFGDLLCQQVDALRPQIVILGGTWDVLPAQLKSQLSDLHNSELDCVNLGGTVYVRSYHPNQSKITHQKYYERVCACLKTNCIAGAPLPEN